MVTKVEQEKTSPVKEPALKEKYVLVKISDYQLFADEHIERIVEIVERFKDIDTIVFHVFFIVMNLNKEAIAKILGNEYYSGHSFGYIKVPIICKINRELKDAHFIAYDISKQICEFMKEYMRYH